MADADSTHTPVDPETRPDPAGLLRLHKPRGDLTWYWRFTDPTTGKRRYRSTGCTRKRNAIRKVRDWQDDLEAESVGLGTKVNWKAELAPLADAYIEFQRERGEASGNHLRFKQGRLRRALADLRLVRAADLDDVARLDARLHALDLPNVTGRRCYQDVLKQFSKWLAGNRRQLDRDPLATWEPVKVKRLRARAEAGETTRASRALLPDEVARALLAADVLDVLHAREHPTRPIWETLLVTAPRTQALTSRNVEDFDPQAARIDYGVGNEKKRRGHGALDPATVETLRGYVGDRSSGPLLRSPRGTRLRRERLLDWWLEAVGLGVLEELWPDDVAWDVSLAFEVNRTLLIGGKVRVGGGNPEKGLRDGTRKARARAKARVGYVVDLVGDEWRERLRGVHIKGFRTTHETWALAVGVPPVAIDKQLGHTETTSTLSMDVMRVASQTGRTHYLDRASRMVDAGQSAAAVRSLLDQALADVAGSGRLIVTNLATCDRATPKRHAAG